MNALNVNKIKIQGLVFDLTINRTKPINCGSKECLLTNLKLLNFLDMMRLHGMYEKYMKESKIVFADDTAFNHRMM